MLPLWLQQQVRKNAKKQNKTKRARGLALSLLSRHASVFFPRVLACSEYMTASENLARGVLDLEEKSLRSQRVAYGGILLLLNRCAAC